jgi:hypothetical protein
MKPDLYTKAVLTVIAAALIVIAFKPFFITPAPYMEVFRLLLQYLPWPTIVFGALFCYRKGINKLLTGSKITKIGGISIDITAPDLEKNVHDILGSDFSPEQKKMLKRLQDEGRVTYLESEMSAAARPLRNAGLIKSRPRGNQLADATTIELTVLGTLVADEAS